MVLRVLRAGVRILAHRRAATAAGTRFMVVSRPMQAHLPVLLVPFFEHGCAAAVAGPAWQGTLETCALSTFFVFLLHRDGPKTLYTSLLYVCQLYLVVVAGLCLPMLAARWQCSPLQCCSCWCMPWQGQSDMDEEEGSVARPVAPVRLHSGVTSMLSTQAPQSLSSCPCWFWGVRA